jgi:hypothetical protein
VAVAIVARHEQTAGLRRDREREHRDGGRRNDDPATTQAGQGRNSWQVNLSLIKYGAGIDPSR